METKHFKLLREKPDIGGYVYFKKTPLNIVGFS